MRKIRKIAWLLVLTGMLLTGSLLRDKALLGSGLIRLHVVGASDSDHDQQVKLRVRDAVLRQISPGMENIQTRGEGEAYIQKMLPSIKKAAEACLKDLGESGNVAVTLGKEAFPERNYDSFTLPAGVYASLRLTLGEGKGRNWWCVVFPAFCGGNFRETAAQAGYPRDLTDTLEGKNKIRFFFLEKLGELENYFFSRK